MANKQEEVLLEGGWTEPLIDEGDVFGSLSERRGTVLFLGRYTMNEVMGELAKMGFLKET